MTAASADKPRPVPLAARADLASVRHDGVSGATWIVKDPVSLGYFELSERQHALLRLLDGRRSFEQLRDGYQSLFRGERPSLAELRAAIDDLHSKGLLVGTGSGQVDALLERRAAARRRAWSQALLNPLYIVLPGWDPEPLLRRLTPLMRLMFHPASLAAAALFVLSSWALLLVRFDATHRALPTFHQFFSWPNVAWLWLTLGAAKMAHELAHGLACRRFGGECHSIGVALLVFSPCLYCDVSDSWMTRAKWKRIAVSAAGVCMELLLSAAALWVWHFTRPSMVHYLALNVFFVTTLTTVLFNANPLLQYDGYYILSDWLEIPNLRARAERFLAETFARVALGKSLGPADPLPTRSIAGFVLYALASAGYRWFLAGTMFLTLYDLLKPIGLQNLGLLVAAGSIVVAVVRMFLSLVRILRMPSDRPARPVRAVVTCAALAGLVAAALLVPIPRHVEAPFLIEPEAARQVFTSAPGRLESVLSRPGRSVARGEPLARFSSFPRESQRAQLALLRDVQRQETIWLARMDRAKELAAARTSLDSIDSQLAELDDQLDQLTIVAPCDGTIVAPPARAARPGGDDSTLLESWDGEPLDPKNVGCWFEPRVLLLSVAPTTRFEAVLYLDQEDRNELESGLPIELKLDASPHRRFAATLGAIGDRQAESIPPGLSNKHGGPLPTTTGPDGAERPQRAVYRAAVLMPEDDAASVRAGMRGTARLRVRPRTAVERLWTAIRSTVAFRL